MPHTATMRFIGGLLVIGAFASALRWLFGNWGEASDTLGVGVLWLAVAVGGLLAARVLVGILRGVARGFRDVLTEARRRDAAA
jgi:hypothetical protein